ncbi:MAG: hypothetical protein ACJ0BK_07475 [Coraliomargaritaceae bacterium]
MRDIWVNILSFFIGTIIFVGSAYIYFFGVHKAATDNGELYAVAAIFFPPYAVFKTGQHHYWQFFPPELDFYEENRFLQVLINHEFQFCELPELDKTELISKLRTRFTNVKQQSKDEIYKLMHDYCDAASAIYMSPLKVATDRKNGIKTNYLESIKLARSRFSEEAITDQLDEMLQSFKSKDSRLFEVAFMQGSNGAIPSNADLEDFRDFVEKQNIGRKAEALQIMRTILK